MSNLLLVFYWWYLSLVKDFWHDYVIGRLIYNLNLTNTLPMAKHISEPLFQDDSSIGKSVSFIIRFIWIGLGSFFSVIVTIPFLIFGIFLILLPFLPVIQLIRYISFNL